MNNILDNWLEYQPQAKKLAFSYVRITEKEPPSIETTRILQEKLLFGYRTECFYSRYFGSTATEEEIRKYILEQVIPADNSQFDRNVRQGDWGEILASLIVSYFQKLEITIDKIQWKFNKDKSVFCTDLIAFDKKNIKDIYYYEIKTRQYPNEKEGKKGEKKQFITVLAYRSLLKDAESPTESIADFLAKLYSFKGDYETADKFMDIVKNPQKYNKKYELFLIVESKKFSAYMLDDLIALSPVLSPLNVVVVLIDNLKQLVDNTWKDIENILIEKYKSNGAIMT
jgi:hypothetical protein